MNTNLQVQLSQYIRSKIENYETLAMEEKDTDRLSIYYDIIGLLNVIDTKLMQTNESKIFEYKGRRVALVKAKNRCEALAALDILREIIVAPDYQYGQRVEEQVYVTKEGSAWCG